VGSLVAVEVAATAVSVRECVISTVTMVSGDGVASALTAAEAAGCIGFVANDAVSSGCATSGGRYSTASLTQPAKIIVARTIMMKRKNDPGNLKFNIRIKKSLHSAGHLLKHYGKCLRQKCFFRACWFKYAPVARIVN
jgi:hypothetical protein